jgi:hypothetical protein
MFKKTIPIHCDSYTDVHSEFLNVNIRTTSIYKCASEGCLSSQMNLVNTLRKLRVPYQAKSS